MDILLITGPPYSGKGTQCEILETKLGYKHISTGDRIREEKTRQTPIGKTMQQYEEKGELVPDEVMETMLDQIFREHQHEKGIILDGYPRTVPQVDTLLRILQRNGLRITHAININVPADVLLERAQKRAATSDRKDDQNAGTHLKRLRIFEEETRPAIAYLDTLVPLHQVNGLGTIPEITEKLLRLV
ncbi:adenylate kinase family protein [Chitinophaga sp. GCM10012297]|uniref:Adenylate kinase n=1 Tax=Chitinophaga chungangae TaxID=2821488 RepID=A0ABS3YBL6_9BACT|nr:nucleoside monophosphate kinase [Chitinophaga chungangae]MBO9152076.1 nucleoside monophosphate kinase [Chitinophaga chungangae]